MATSKNVPLPPIALRRFLRVSGNISLREAAEQMEVTPSAVFRWESEGPEGAEPKGRNRRVYAAWIADRLAEFRDVLLEHEDFLASRAA